MRVLLQLFGVEAVGGAGEPDAVRVCQVGALLPRHLGMFLLENCQLRLEVVDECLLPLDHLLGRVVVHRPLERVQFPVCFSGGHRLHGLLIPKFHFRIPNGSHYSRLHLSKRLCVSVASSLQISQGSVCNSSGGGSVVVMMYWKFELSWEAISRSCIRLK